MKFLGFGLLILSAVAKAFKDSIMNGALKDWGDWWWIHTSWCAKWKDCEPGVEAFFGSSTVFVAFTDGWHLFQGIFLNLLFLGLWFIRKEKWWVWVLTVIGYRIVFEIAWRILQNL